MPRAGLTRDKVVAAAGAFADEQGFEMLTLAALARALNIRVPSLYAHIASSDDLKKSVALLALNRLADRTEAAVAGRSGKDALFALADAHREFARLYPGQFHAARYPLDSESAAGSGGARLARVSHSMLRGYDLKEDDRVHATRLVGAFVLGFSLLELAGSFGHSNPDPQISWLLGVEGLDLLIKSWAAPETQAH